MKVTLLGRSLRSQNMGTHLCNETGSLMGLFFYLNPEVETWSRDVANP